MTTSVAEMLLKDGPMLTVRQAAGMIGISVRNFYSLTKEPGFPVVRVSERRVVVPQGALMRWIEAKNEARG